MTDVILVNTIAKEVKKMLESESIRALYGNEFEDIKVYEHDLPLAEYEDDSRLRNYIVIVIGWEESDSEEWNVEVHFSINIEDKNKNRSGNVNILNLMNEIYMYFIKKGFIGNSVKMEKNAYKALNTEISYPYYEGDLITNWKLLLPLEEGLEAFL